MKNLAQLTFLLILTFSNSVLAQTNYSAVVSSSDGYDVNVTLTPHTVVAPGSCQSGYNFKIKIDYEITFSGNNIPNKLWTLQGNLGCGSISNSFFSLPNKGGEGMTLTANSWNSNSDCATATVESLFCDDFVLTIEGPGIPNQAVSLSSTTLPVELYSYDVNLKDNNVSVEWATATETDNEYFVIEKSQDAIHFEELGIEEGAGTSTAFRYYSFIDKFPFQGISYYRLKQVDYDGTATYSDIKTIDNEDSSREKYSLNVFPNPITQHSKFNIELEGFTNKNVIVKIQNMNGLLIYSNEITITQEQALIEVPTNILRSSGMYAVSVFSNNKWHQYKFMYLP